jgi:hypothetical protein
MNGYVTYHATQARIDDFLRRAAEHRLASEAARGADDSRLRPLGRRRPTVLDLRRRAIAMIAAVWP